MTDTKTLLQARFAELQAERDAVLEALIPHQEAIAAKQAEIDVLKDEMAVLAEAKKEAEAPMAAITQEMTSLAIALGGKTMSGR